LEISDNDIIFDPEKPMGQHRKPAISNAPDDFKFTKLEDGIKETIDWFIENYNIIRK
jgi:GDP-L-fucose synthase